MEQWLISTVWGIIILGTIGGILAYILIQITKRILKGVEYKLLHTVRPFLYRKLDKYDGILKKYIDVDLDNYGEKMFLLRIIQYGINGVLFLIGFFSSVILTFLTYTLIPENYQMKILFIASTTLFILLLIGVLPFHFYYPILYKKMIRKSDDKTVENKDVNLE